MTCEIEENQINKCYLHTLIISTIILIMKWLSKLSTSELIGLLLEIKLGEWDDLDYI